MWIDLINSHLEDLVQLLITIYIFAISTKLSFVSIRNAKKVVSQTEKQHNTDHISFSLLTSIVSFFLVISYGAHLWLSAHAPVHLDKVSEFVNVTGKIFETFMLVAYAWIIRHMNQEESDSGRYHETIYPESHNNLS